jgi:hypothetical protein
VFRSGPARLSEDAGTAVPPGPGDEWTADRVVLAGGRGALVRSGPVSPRYLVTDEGRKYPLSGDDAAAALGYGGIPPAWVPAELLALLPTGPALDPGTARLPVPPPSGPAVARPSR